MSSWEAEVTLGRNAAVKVTMVPPAAVAVDGSMEETEGVWVCMVTEAAMAVAFRFVGGDRGVRERTAMPEGTAGRVMVTARVSRVEWMRERAGAVGKAIPVTFRVRSVADVTVKWG